MKSVQIMNNSDQFSSFENLLILWKDKTIDLQLKKNLISEFISKGKNNFPLVKDDEIYFIYIGNAKLVHVVGDFNGWDSFDTSSKMNRLDNTDIFYLKKFFPIDSRLDYQFVVDTDWLLDPYNECKILGGFGFNSELRMPRHTKKQNIYPKIDSLRKGTIQEIIFESNIQKHWKRKIYIYLPPQYNPENEIKYPTIYAIDGTDFLSAGNAKEIIDNLIADQRIPEILVIFIDPVSPELRIRDFNSNPCLDSSENTDEDFNSELCRENYCKFLVSELIPYIDNNYNTITDNPTKRAHIGVSLGGILSTYVGSKYPNLFKLIGSQSGAFWIDKTVYERFVEIEPIKDMKFYLNAGIFEKRILNHTKAFATILKNKKYLIKEEYFNQGHSWGLWKETLGPMLEFLLN